MDTNGSAKKSDRLQVMQTNVDDHTCETYVFKGEDHTLGNSLRYLISKNPEVSFCGYTIPHPFENKIHLRIETFGVSCRDVLIKGLKDLHELCEHVLETFEGEVTNFKESNPSEGDMDAT